jgi:hypothetical protein
VTYAGAPVTICGTIDTGHFDPSGPSVDVDAYSFTVGAAGADLRVQFTGTSLDTAGDVLFRVMCPVGGFAFGNVIGGVGVANTSAHASPGECSLYVFALGPNALTTPRDYQVKLLPGTPATWCPKITATADYTESHDGVNNDGNDVISRVTPPSAPYVTPATTDAPEPTGLTINPGDARRLTGSSAAVPPVAQAAWSDPDTYEITTGPTTTELTWRLNWAATNADLDVSLYPEASLATTPTFISSGFLSSKREAESDTTVVLPNTKYLMWVGAKQSSAVATPVAYDISLCGATFTAH